MIREVRLGHCMLLSGAGPLLHARKSRNKLIIVRNCWIECVFENIIIIGLKCFKPVQVHTNSETVRHSYTYKQECCNIMFTSWQIVTVSS